VGAATATAGLKPQSDGRRSHDRFLGADGAVVMIVAVTPVVWASISPSSCGSDERVPAGATILTVERRPLGRVIPAGFLGPSLEFPAVEAYAGADPPPSIAPSFYRRVAQRGLDVGLLRPYRGSFERIGIGGGIGGRGKS
jgi:hypothetical protein